MMYRQGDVLIRSVSAIPETAKAEPVEEVVLALGEATGHRHRFKGGKRSGVRAFRALTGDRFFRARRGAQLVHEEHGTIEIPAGDYEVVLQREYVAPQVTRQVLD